MSKFIFKHLSEDGSKTIHTIDEDVCTEVIRSFVYFLKGCSFHDKSILNAMTTIVEELEGE